MGLGRETVAEGEVLEREMDWSGRWAREAEWSGREKDLGMKMGLGMDMDWGGSWVREGDGLDEEDRLGKGEWAGFGVMVLRRDMGLGWLWVAEGVVLGGGWTAGGKWFAGGR